MRRKISLGEGSKGHGNTRHKTQFRNKTGVRTEAQDDRAEETGGRRRGGQGPKEQSPGSHRQDSEFTVSAEGDH